MGEDKKAKVKKGWLAVAVGDGCRRFTIPITHLHHPYFRQLLDAAYDAYGYTVVGPLRLPCSVDDFLRLRWLVEHESATGIGHGGGCGGGAAAFHRHSVHSC